MNLDWNLIFEKLDSIYDKNLWTPLNKEERSAIKRVVNAAIKRASVQPTAEPPATAEVCGIGHP